MLKTDIVFKMKSVLFHGHPTYSVIVTLIVLCVAIVVMSRDQCKRQEFIMMPGSSADGEVLVHDGPWTWKLCRRVCRQYLECLAFKVRIFSNISNLVMQCIIQFVVVSQIKLIVWYDFLNVPPFSFHPKDELEHKYTRTWHVYYF